jgi:hypothetical protein
MFMIDLLALYGIIKLHVNNFLPKQICLYALPILCIFHFCPTVMRNILCDYAC